MSSDSIDRLHDEIALMELGGIIKNMTPSNPFHEPAIAIRAPLPDAVKARIEIESHPRRGSCLILRYDLGDERDLIATLEQTIDAIRRGPSHRLRLPTPNEENGGEPPKCNCDFGYPYASEDCPHKGD